MESNQSNSIYVVATAYIVVLVSSSLLLCTSTIFILIHICISKPYVYGISHHLDNNFALAAN
jgi:hypothetical protein